MTEDWDEGEPVYKQIGTYVFPVDAVTDRFVGERTTVRFCAATDFRASNKQPFLWWPFPAAEVTDDGR